PRSSSACTMLAPRWPEAPVTTAVKTCLSVVTQHRALLRDAHEGPLDQSHVGHVRLADLNAGGLAVLPVEITVDHAQALRIAQAVEGRIETAKVVHAVGTRGRVHGDLAYHHRVAVAIARVWIGLIRAAGRATVVVVCVAVVALLTRIGRAVTTKM